ncbi:hypothetical protein BGW38_005424 [Lunasporangiospora selenospora]|uniref:Uncharacterized protein n=1 Tax=Lunasporangiospora selenospora TaxID=979761 RepID=A0A9P6G0B4_9FUNG|nr:hypothetical protein BGW38_005424 [Lunasporangiospora selenospora]
MNAHNALNIVLEDASIEGNPFEYKSPAVDDICEMLNQGTAVDGICDALKDLNQDDIAKSICIELLKLEDNYDDDYDEEDEGSAAQQYMNAGAHTTQDGAIGAAKAVVKSPTIISNKYHFVSETEVR